MLFTITKQQYIGNIFNLYSLGKLVCHPSFFYIKVLLKLTVVSSLKFCNHYDSVASPESLLASVQRSQTVLESNNLIFLSLDKIKEVGIILSTSISHGSSG